MKFKYLLVYLLKYSLHNKRKKKQKLLLKLCPDIGELWWTENIFTLQNAVLTKQLNCLVVFCSIR